MSFYQYFPKSLASWGLKNIIIEFNDNIPTAGVKFDNDSERFRMYINPSFWDGLDEADRKRLIAHEISHILRGDVFVRDEEYNPELSNIAMDTLINTVLKIERIGNTEAWYLERLKKQLSPERAKKLDTPFLLGWKTIYDILKEEQKEEIKNSLADIIPSEISEKAKDIIAEGIIKGRIPVNGDGDTELDKEIQEAISNISGNVVKITMAGNNKGDKNSLVPQTTPNPTLLTIIKNIEAIKKGKRYKRKTYRREGILPELRGKARIPTLDVLVALDISGSVLDKIDKMSGLIQYLKQKQLSFEFGTFSDTWRVYPSIRFKDLEGYGGGTCVKELFDYIKKRNPSLVIIITDGELYDFDKSFLKIPNKIIWVFTEDVNNELLKNSDIALKLEN